MWRLVLAFLCCVSPAVAAPVLAIEKTTAAKDIPVWFVRDTHLPIVTLKFSMRGGAQLDDVPGTAELLSTLLDEGAGARDAEQFQDALDQNGVQLGFGNGRDYFSGSLKTTTPFRDLGLGLLSDALNNPHLDEAAIARMRQSLLSSQRFSQENPSWIAEQKLFATLFPNTPYGRMPEGTPETIAKITRNDLLAVRAKLFCRQRLNVSVVGDVDEKIVKQMVDTLFGAWPDCKDTATEQPIAFAKPANTQITRDGVQTVIVMAQPGLARQDPDWWAARIIDFVLGGGEFSSRLMNEVRVKRGLTYGISTSLIPYDRAPLWLAQAGVDSPYRDQAVSLVKQVWGEIADKGITADELAEAKAYLTGSLPLMLSTSDQIAGVLLQLQQDHLPINTLDTRAEQINAVTLQDVQRVAKKYLQPQSLSVVAVGPSLAQKVK